MMQETLAIQNSSISLEKYKNDTKTKIDILSLAYSLKHE